MCDGGRGHRSIHTKQKVHTGSFRRFVVPHTPLRQTTNPEPRQHPQSTGSAQPPPESRVCLRVRDVRRRCYERSEAAVSASLSRVLSARETAGDHGAGEEEEEEEGWLCVGSG